MSDCQKIRDGMVKAIAHVDAGSADPQKTLRAALKACEHLATQVASLQARMESMEYRDRSRAAAMQSNPFDYFWRGR